MTNVPPNDWPPTRFVRPDGEVSGLHPATGVVLLVLITVVLFGVIGTAVLII